MGQSGDMNFNNFSWRYNFLNALLPLVFCCRLVWCLFLSEKRAINVTGDLIHLIICRKVVVCWFKLHQNLFSINNKQVEKITWYLKCYNSSGPMMAYFTDAYMHQSALKNYVLWYWTQLKISDKQMIVWFYYNINFLKICAVLIC